MGEIPQFETKHKHGRRRSEIPGCRCRRRTAGHEIEYGEAEHCAEDVDGGDR